ncbi:hypothetical protein, partial [Sansalvadorimonas verongulae]|uniref:hypothetical protein n=1 Tax=Sansalvadorimonas verongulae TaxID=2172824 RepID=UPI0012BC6F14
MSAHYQGRAYPIPVPAEFQGREAALQSYCRGYLKAAGVLTGAEQGLSSDPVHHIFGQRIDSLV